MNSNSPQQPNQEHQTSIELSRPVPPTEFEQQFSLLRIHADNQDKRTICIFWVIFFVVIIVISIVSAFLPHGTYGVSNQSQLYGTGLENCSNPNWIIDSDKKLLCSQYKGINETDPAIGTMIAHLQRENQFALIYYNFKVKDASVTTPSYFLNYSDINVTANLALVELTTKMTGGKEEFYALQGSPSKETFKVNFASASILYGDDKRTMLGYSVPIYILRNFKEQSYVLILSFEEPLSTLPNIEEVETWVLLVNEKYTIYSIVIRYVFFGLSLIACVIYILSFKRIPKTERILEQKMIVVLSILLVFFNDPLYPVTVLFPNKASSYFSVFFVINFIVFLLFTWIIFLDRINFEDGQKETNLIEWKRLGYIVVTYALILTLYTLISFDYIENLPIVPAQDLMGKNFVVLEAFSIIFFLFGIIYIVINYVRIFLKMSEMLWRNQLFLLFSIFFIVLTVAFFFVEGFEINSLTGSRILLLYTIMNMYTFYLQYMYSITSEERERSRRGHYENQGIGLLEINSADGDCVDLDFDEELPGHGMDKKLNAFVNRNEQQNKNKEEEIEYEIEEENKYYENKTENQFQENQSNFNENPKINEKHENIDFFKEQENFNQETQKTNKNKDEFSEFSLD